MWYTSYVDRFWSKVNKTNSCWLWTGSPDNNGYGQFRFNGKILKSHVYVWRIELNNSGFATQLCKNRLCVNPSHLVASSGYRVKGDGNAVKVKYSAYKAKAKDKNILFDLSLDEFEYITSKKCFYCGIDPKIWVAKKTTYEPILFNGIDRVNNSLGYINSNVVPCCSTCNYMKKDLTTMDFLHHVLKIANHECGMI